MSIRVKQVDAAYLDKKKSRDLSRIKFPKNFKVKISMEKVHFPIIKRWIRENLNQLLPDDDIVIDFLLELLKEQESPDIKNIQLQLQSFLDDDASIFCGKLWDLLVSAQDDPDGIPAELIAQRKRELEESITDDSHRGISDPKYNERTDSRYGDDDEYHDSYNTRSNRRERSSTEYERRREGNGERVYDREYPSRSYNDDYREKQTSHRSSRDSYHERERTHRSSNTERSREMRTERRSDGYRSSRDHRERSPESSRHHKDYNHSREHRGGREPADRRQSANTHRHDRERSQDAYRDPESRDEDSDNEKKYTDSRRDRHRHRPRYRHSERAAIGSSSRSKPEDTRHRSERSRPKTSRTPSRSPVQ